MERDEGGAANEPGSSGGESPGRLHRIALLAAALAVVLFSLWRCG